MMRLIVLLLFPLFINAQNNIECGYKNNAHTCWGNDPENYNGGYDPSQESDSPNLISQNHPIDKLGIRYESYYKQLELTPIQTSNLIIPTKPSDYIKDYEDTNCEWSNTSSSGFKDIDTKKSVTYLTDPHDFEEQIEIKKFRNDKTKLEVNLVRQAHFNEYLAPVKIRFREYKSEDKLPILGITVDECIHYEFVSVFIDFQSARKWSTTKEKTSLKNYNNDEIMLKGAVNKKAQFDFHAWENILGLNAYIEFYNDTKPTVIEVLCDGCKKRTSSQVEIDFTQEKKQWLVDTKIEREKKAAEEKRERERIERERELAYEKFKKEEEKEIARIKKIRQLEKESEVRNNSYSALPDELKKDKIKLLKKECANLGFKNGSDDFKDCVVELMN